MDIKDVASIMKNPTDTCEYRDNANSVINRPIPKELIKSREGAGKMTLSYIEGETVIRLLNEAFGPEGWSFQVVTKCIVESQPKQMTEYDSATRKVKKLYNTDGTPKMEPQPPIAEVLGRMIVPGFGVREQFGTKVLIGGSSEQEGASKAAATDALKKCATLFGIGLELYENKGEQPQAQNTGYKKDYNNKGYNTQKSGYESKPSTPSYTPAPKIDDNQWVGKDADIRKLKELKAIIGIDDNGKLDPFVAEFTGSKNDTYEKITPANISAFNKFLEKKAANA